MSNDPLLQPCAHGHSCRWIVKSCGCMFRHTYEEILIARALESSNNANKIAIDTSHIAEQARIAAMTALEMAQKAHDCAQSLITQYSLSSQQFKQTNINNVQHTHSIQQVQQRVQAHIPLHQGPRVQQARHGTTIIDPIVHTNIIKNG
jgi:hypothetical protein